MNEELEKEKQNDRNESRAPRDSCPVCAGTGKLAVQTETGERTVRCPACNGGGRVRAPRARRSRRIPGLRRPPVRRGRGLRVGQHGPGWSRGIEQAFFPEPETQGQASQAGPERWPEPEPPEPAPENLEKMEPDDLKALVAKMDATSAAVAEKWDGMRGHDVPEVMGYAQAYPVDNVTEGGKADRGRKPLMPEPAPAPVSTEINYDVAGLDVIGPAAPGTCDLREQIDVIGLGINPPGG